MSTPLNRYIGTKELTLDQRMQWPIGGGDDPRVDAARGVAAHALDAQVLDGPQQLGLGRQRKVRYLIEEQRAAIGVFELAPAPFNSRRRPFLDAEQLGLQQRFHQRGAVDRHEWPRAVGSAQNLARNRALPTPRSQRAAQNGNSVVSASRVGGDGFEGPPPSGWRGTG